MREILNEIDPRNLIHDSYVIENISESQCRSIFLDWAMFDSHDMPQHDRIVLLFNHFNQIDSAHPMTTVLKAALAPAQKPSRKGGRKARNL